MVGTPLVFVRTPEDLKASLAEAPELVILDLTTNGWDYEAFFAALESVTPRPPVLGFTTHALAKATHPLHGRCTRVVTKETLTQELPELLRSGVAA